VAALERSFSPVSAAVIHKRRSVAPDRPPKGPAKRGVQAAPGGDVQGVGATQRVDARGMESFVAVDVPQPGDNPLIQQQGFDLPAPVEHPGEFREGGIERLDAHLPDRLGFVGRPFDKRPHPSETPWIAKAKFQASVIQANAQVGVRGHGLPGRMERQPSGHAQAKDQPALRGQIDHHPLGPPADADHPAVGQPLGQGLPIAVQDITAKNVHAGNRPAAQPVLQAAGDGFGLG
jgi:hypothetical protein